MRLETDSNKVAFYQTAWFALGVILVLFVLGWWQELLDLSAVNFTGLDGGKNQFAFIDYVLYGDGFMSYGMNYPFGEHIIFTDNQPPLAIIIKFIHDHIFSLEHSLLSIHNFWVLLQILLGAISFYYFLRNVVGHNFLALLGAMLVVYLSPQLLRLHTHFSLSYIFFYGATFNCLWFILANKKVVFYSCCLFVLVFLGGFSHLYNFMAVLLFATFYMLFGLLYGHLRLKQVGLVFLSLLFAGLLIIFLVQGLDPFPLRPQSASGLFEYSATFEGTFYPMFGQEGALFQRLFQINSLPNWEGRNFLGFVALILNVIFIIVYAIQKKFRTKESKVIFIFWLSGFFVWLYASEVFFAPFNKDFIGSLPYLNQFRSIGRFGIVFYYLVGVVGVYMLKHFWFNDMRWLRIVVASLVLIWGLEAFYNFEALKTEGQITRQGALFEKPIFQLDSILKLHDRSLSDYQCGLILPIATSSGIGSEHEGSFFALHYGARMRLESKLPIINSIYTRGAINHGIGVAQLASTLPAKKILLPFLNAKKILLMYTTTLSELTEGNKRLLKHATFIGKGNTCFYAEIDKSTLLSMQKVTDDSLLEREQQSIVKINKVAVNKGQYSLATFDRVEAKKGVHIKLVTSLEPQYEVAQYWIDLLDKQGGLIWQISMHANNDYDGLSNIIRMTILPAHLINVSKLRVMTDKPNEHTNLLSMSLF